MNVGMIISVWKVLPSRLAVNSLMPMASRMLSSVPVTVNSR